MEIGQITQKTLEHYERSAQQFFEGTRDHDVSQNIAALLDAIEGVAPFRILDLGCGPGRDLKRFTELGHIATGLDGSAEFARMARDYSGCDVLQQDFIDLQLPAETFDGVFANASLFHVPSAALPDVLPIARKASDFRPRSRARTPRASFHAPAIVIAV